MTKERLQEIRRALGCLDWQEWSTEEEAQAFADLLAAYDELASAHKILADEYADAIRALRSAEWGSLEINETDEAVGESCPCCHRLEDYRRAYGDYLAGHAEGCPLWLVLSTPRAKEVE